MSIVDARGTSAQRSSWVEAEDHEPPKPAVGGNRARSEANRAERRQFEENVKRLAAEAMGDTSTAFDPRGFYVYVLWDEAGACVYVGQSANVLGRLGQHMAPSKKGSLVTRVTLTKCDSRLIMTALERLLIHTLSPKDNLAWNPSTEA